MEGKHGKGGTSLGKKGDQTHPGAWGALWGEECGRKQTTPMWFGH